MKIELNEHASNALSTLFWAGAFAVILTAFSNCAARSNEAAAHSVKLEGNTVVNVK